MRICKLGWGGRFDLMTSCTELLSLNCWPHSCHLTSQLLIPNPWADCVVLPIKYIYSEYPSYMVPPLHLAITDFIFPFKYKFSHNLLCSNSALHIYIIYSTHLPPLHFITAPCIPLICCVRSSMKSCSMYVFTCLNTNCITLPIDLITFATTEATFTFIYHIDTN